MTISMTCTCSARLEIDERFAGQTVACPDCQVPLTVPALKENQTRTSGFALAGLTLAITGMLTVVGTLAAILCGLIGLVQIQRDPEHLSGKGFAVASIVLGVVFTLLSLFAYTSTELFGIDNIFRKAQWYGKLDFDGPLTVKRDDEGFEITRPSGEWGVFKDGTKETFGTPRRRLRDLLLVNPGQPAYIIVSVEPLELNATFEDCKKEGLELFRHLEVTHRSLSRNSELDANIEIHPTKNKLRTTNNLQYAEMVVDKTVQGRTLTYVLQIVWKTDDTVMYVLAAGADKDNFPVLEEQLRQALDSVQFFERPLPGEDERFPRINR